MPPPMGGFPGGPGFIPPPGMPAGIMPGAMPPFGMPPPGFPFPPMQPTPSKYYLTNVLSKWFIKYIIVKFNHMRVSFLQFRIVSFLL